jgi:hypothetical protein
MPHRDLDVGRERVALVLRRLVETGLTHAEHGGLAKNSGNVFWTSRVSVGFSASFGFTATHEKWRMPYWAARVGSNSLICRK